MRTTDSCPHSQWAENEQPSSEWKGNLGDTPQHPLQALHLEMNTRLELEEKSISICFLQYVDSGKTERHN